MKYKHENINGQFKCEACNKTFQNEVLYKSHMKQSHSQVKCDICQKEVCNRIVLLKHKVTVHGIEDGALFCPICPKNKAIFMAKNTLNIHMKNKHGLKQF